MSPSSSSSLDVVELSSDDDVELLLLLVVFPSVVLPLLDVVLLSLELPEEVVESFSSLESELVAVLLPSVLESSVLMVSTSVMSNRSSCAGAELDREDRLLCDPSDWELPALDDRWEEREDAREEFREELREEAREAREEAEDTREAVELRRLDRDRPRESSGFFFLPALLARRGGPRASPCFFSFLPFSFFFLSLFRREDRRGGRCGGGAWRSRMNSSAMGLRPPGFRLPPEAWLLPAEALLLSPRLPSSSSSVV